MSTLKKVFFLSLFIFILSALFWGVYNLSFKNDSSDLSNTSSSDNNNEVASNTSSTMGTEKISPISPKAILAPTLSTDGASINYFSQESGQFLQVDFYGNTQKNLSTKNISNLLDAFWSVDKLKLILKLKNPTGSPYFSFLDIISGKDIPLKNSLERVTWQNNANRILYKYYDPSTKERTLNISDPDGSNWNKIAALNYRNVSIAQVPKTGLISFWNSGDAYLQTLFQTIPLIGGETKTLLATGFGADYLWSPLGNQILVSRTNSQGGSKMELGVMNANGGEYKNLGIPTFVDKCAWSNDGQFVYYALPGGIPDNSVLPNDYKAGKFETTDTFWKVSTKTGEKNRLVEIEDIAGQYNVSQLFLNKSESLLFFVNKIDGKLYKISL